MLLSRACFPQMRDQLKAEEEEAQRQLRQATREAAAAQKRAKAGCQCSVM